MKNYVINSNICISCDACKVLCPVGAITDEYVIDPAICIGCGQCKENCNAGAIECQEKFLTWNDFNNEYDGKTGFNKITNDTTDDIKSTDIFIWGGEFLNNIFKKVTNQQETNLVEDLNKKMITELPPYPIQDTPFIFDEITLSKISDDNTTSTVIKTIKNIDNTNIDDFNNCYTLGFEHTNELDSKKETPSGKTPYTVSATKGAYIDAISKYMLTLHIKDSKSFESISESGIYVENISGYPASFDANTNTITFSFKCTYADRKFNTETGEFDSTDHALKKTSLHIPVKGCKIISDDNGTIVTVDEFKFTFSIYAYTPTINRYNLSDYWLFDANGDGKDDDNNYNFPSSNISTNLLNKFKYCIKLTPYDIYNDTTNTKYGVYHNYIHTNTITLLTYQLVVLPTFPNVYLYTYLGAANDNHVKLKYNLNNQNTYQSVTSQNILVENSLTGNYIPHPTITLCMDGFNDIEYLRESECRTMNEIITKTY